MTFASNQKGLSGVPEVSESGLPLEIKDLAHCATEKTTQTFVAYRASNSA